MISEIQEIDGTMYTVNSGPMDERHRASVCNTCGNTGAEWEDSGCPSDRKQCLFTFPKDDD